MIPASNCGIRIRSQCDYKHTSQPIAECLARCARGQQLCTLCAQSASPAQYEPSPVSRHGGEVNAVESFFDDPTQSTLGRSFHLRACCVCASRMLCTLCAQSVSPAQYGPSPVSRHGGEVNAVASFFDDYTQSTLGRSFHLRACCVRAFRTFLWDYWACRYSFSSNLQQHMRGILFCFVFV